MILSKEKLMPLLDKLAGARDVFVPAHVNGVAKFARYGEGVEVATAFGIRGP